MIQSEADYSLHRIERLMFHSLVIHMTIQLANNPVYHSKTKHIDLVTHYIRDLVADGIITLEYCPTEKQAADIFTKSMTEAKFVGLRSLLGMREVVIQGGMLVQ